MHSSSEPHPQPSVENLNGLFQIIKPRGVMPRCDSHQNRSLPLSGSSHRVSHRAKPRLQPCKVHPAFQPEQPQCLILYLSLRTRRSLLLSSLSRAVINTQSCRDLKETAGLLSTHNKLPHYRTCLCHHVLQSSLAGLGQGPEVCISGRLRLGARDHTLVMRLQEGWADSVSPPSPRGVLRFCPPLSRERSEGCR